VIPTEFTPRKVKRKLHRDGPIDVAVAAADLFTRKRVGRRLFDPLVEGGSLRTLSRRNLLTRAKEVVQLSDDTDAPNPFVAWVDGGYVLSETGLVLTQSFELLGESAATPPQAQQAMMAMCSRELFFGSLPVRGLLTDHARPDAPVLKTAAPLIPRYPNYYHWMVETVPKVRYLETFELATGTDVTVLLPEGAPPFVQETLQLLDWPASKTIVATEPIYEVRNLVLPSFPERTAVDFDWLRGELLRAVDGGNSSTGNGTNVYVSRANAIERRVLNEDAVMATLSEFGFRRYHLEDRSLAANVRLFSDADVIVGPHGAGLTDIIFARDCTLVELFGAKVKQPYEVLADTLGMDYEPMYCRADAVDIIVDNKELSSKILDINS